MEWVETTGRTVTEAKDLALDQLGVDEADAEFEILDEPRPGLFGRMRGEARVRARVRPTRPRPKVERRDRRRKRDADAASPRGGAALAETTEVAAAAGAEASTSASSSRRRGGRSQRSAAPSADGAPSDRPSGVPTTDQQEATTMDTNHTPADADPSAAGQEAVSPEAVGTEAVRFVEGLLDAFGLDGDVELRMAGDDLEVSITGDDLGVMIGPRGTTLLAVQDLTRVVAQRRLGDHETRLRVDIGGYRERRRAALGRFAVTMADEVVASGTARVLEPMPSADRKVVHDVLSEREDVVTRSEGEDPFRRVVISPAQP
jgi:spoIIIJ-associated protein